MSQSTGVEVSCKACLGPMARNAEPGSGVVLNVAEGAGVFATVCPQCGYSQEKTDPRAS